MANRWTHERLHFRVLWTYRFHKYTHIVGKFWSFLIKYLRMRWLKRQIGNRKLVAIILSEQMGDIVACEPVAREVRRKHPTDYIIWMVRKPYVELVSYHPDLDGYLIEKCPGERARLLRSGIFDVVYNMHISHRNCKYCLEDTVNPTADRINLTFDNYLDRGSLLYVFSQAAGLPALSDPPKMYIPETVPQKIATMNLPQKFIVLHCQSSYYLRDWPAHQWNALVKWLFSIYPYPIIEVGMKTTITETNPLFHSVCGQLSLLETAEVIRQAFLFIGVESGPAHMANAMQTESIILKGQLFDFVDYMPYSGRFERGEGITIINNYGHPCAELPYNWVQEAVAKQLGSPQTV